MNIIKCLKHSGLFFFYKNRDDLNKPTIVVNRLVEELKKSIVRWSIGDSTLLFSTAFVVYVPEKDYKDIFAVFGLITKDASSKFNEIIRITLQGRPNLEYYPFRCNWAFILSSLGEGQEDIPDPDKKDDIVTYNEVNEKFAAIRSYPSNNSRKPYINYSVKDDDQEGTNRGKNRNSNKDKAMVLCIGPVQKNLNDSGDGFNWPIEINQTTKLQKPHNVSSENKNESPIVNVEILSEGIHFEGPNISICEISLSRFFIGGSTSEDIYNDIPVVKLSTDKIINPHIEIMVEDNRINIRSLAATSLCGRNLVPRSEEWVKMPLENAYVKLNNDIELKFSLE